MALAGEGAVAILARHRTRGDAVGFYAWHGEEHMPERVGIPGFLRGRRYVASDADLEFFNLYETLTPQALTGADYLGRLEAPTPWTAATVLHFRHVARSLCRVAASYGKGCGGLAATLRYDVAEAERGAHLARMADEVLPRLAAAPGNRRRAPPAGRRAASRRETAEVRARADGGNAVPAIVVMVEGWGDEAPFRAVVAERLGPAALGDATKAAAPGFYRLQATRLKTAFAAG